MQPKAEYMLRRIREELGPEESNRLIEALYDLIIVEKTPHQTVIKRLKERVGRPSKIHTYTKIKNHQEALKQLKQDLEEGRIGRATYFRAKKQINQHK